jgi:hypothetical protein
VEDLLTEELNFLMKRRTGEDGKPDNPKKALPHSPSDLRQAILPLYSSWRTESPGIVVIL